MAKVLPKIYYDQNRRLDIEVVSFSDILTKLMKIKKTHDSFLPHRITFYLAIFVTEGEIEHFVDFNLYSLQKGSAIFIAKNQVHHFTTSFKNAKGYCLILNKPFLENDYFLPNNIKYNRLYNYHLDEPVIHQDQMGADSFVNLVHKLYGEYHFPDNFAKFEILRAQIHLILLKAERAKQKNIETESQPYWFEVFNNFKNKLEQEYMETRSSRYYASELNISYKFLNDVVKSLTQKTIKVFIDDFVTTEIKRYLVSTSLSVKEIGYKTGFDDLANMIKFFKKNAHKTPVQFRESLK